MRTFLIAGCSLVAVLMAATSFYYGVIAHDYAHGSYDMLLMFCNIAVAWWLDLGRTRSGRRNGNPE